MASDPTRHRPPVSSPALRASGREVERDAGGPRGDDQAGGDDPGIVQREEEAGFGDGGRAPRNAGLTLFIDISPG